MFADADARRLRGDRLKLAAVFGRGVGLEVEAIQLRKAAGKEDVDDRFDPRFPALAGKTAERGQVIHAEAEQTDGACLEGRAAREHGMVQRRVHNLAHKWRGDECNIRNGSPVEQGNCLRLAK